MRIFLVEYTQTDGGGGGVGHLVSLLARRRSVAVVSLVLVGLGRLELRRSPGLEVCRVLRSLRSGGRPVVLLELQGVLRVELGLLLEPAVILLLVLGVLGRVQGGLGRSSCRTSVLLGWTSGTSVASPGVSSGSLRVDR